MTFMDSKTLLAKCQAGDERAIEALVRQFQPRLFRLALSLLDDGRGDSRADAEEATQDALISALNALGSYRGQAALSTWLYAITVNICRNRLRARRRWARIQNLIQRLWLSDEDDHTSAENLLESRETHDNLLKAVNGLKEIHRLPLILRYYHDLSIHEIAQILDLPEGTVHSRLNTARARLKIYLSESDEGRMDEPDKP